MSDSGAGKPDPIKLGDPDLSDVVLIVDQQQFHVQKLILANRSDYFKAMFCGQFKEAHADRVEIKDVPVDAFRRLLELIYNGSISDRDKFLPFKKIMFEKFLSDDFEEAYREYVGHIWDGAEQQQQYIASFWKCVGELLATADLFNLTKIVLDYLQQAISLDICCRKDCAICLNYWVFAEEHGLDGQQKDRCFADQTLKCWFDAINAAPSCRGPMGYNVLSKMFYNSFMRDIHEFRS